MSNQGSKFDRDDATEKNILHLQRVGCAGWNIPKDYAQHFPTDGTHLQRYAQVFSVVEINSSFYRPHKPSTYQRWAASVPEGFLFAVKVPRTITHFRRLVSATGELDAFLEECGHLGDKLGPLLVQLPPRLAFDPAVAGAFLGTLRERFAGNVACEPRHPTWFTEEADSLLSCHRVGRVAADPAIVPEAAEPGGWDALVYYRLHGSPRIYYSAYPPEYLSAIVERLGGVVNAGKEAWCIFDNTAEGAAAGDALTVMKEAGLSRP